MGRLSTVSAPVRGSAKGEGCPSASEGQKRSAVGTPSPTSCRPSRSPPPASMTGAWTGPPHRAPPTPSGLTPPRGRSGHGAGGSRTAPSHPTVRGNCESRPRDCGRTKTYGLRRPPVERCVSCPKARPGTRLIVVRSEARRAPNLERRSVPRPDLCVTTDGRRRECVCLACLCVHPSPKPAEGPRLQEFSALAARSPTRPGVRDSAQMTHPNLSNRLIGTRPGCRRSPDEARRLASGLCPRAPAGPRGPGVRLPARPSLFIML